MQEIDWNILEPFAPEDPRYVFNTEALEKYAARVLEQNVNGVKMLTLVRPSTSIRVRALIRASHGAQNYLTRRRR